GWQQIVESVLGVRAIEYRFRSESDKIPHASRIGLPVQPFFSHPKGRSLAMKRALSRGAWSAWVVIGLLSTAGLGSPQSLGEVARRARERRELEGKKSKKIYTNDDFPSAAPAAMEAPNPRPLAADSKERSAKVDEAELEKQWRRRFAEARARLRKAEQDAWQTSIKTVCVGGGVISGLTGGAA